MGGRLKLRLEEQITQNLLFFNLMTGKTSGYSQTDLISEGDVKLLLTHE